MKFQGTEYWCGVASMAAAARALGRPASQQRLAKLAPATEDGTDEEGIRRGLLAIGLVPEVLNSNIRLAARNWLVLKLRMGYPVILCHGRQRWQHWVCAVGMLGNKFIVFDPARYEYRVNSGVQHYDFDNLARWWYAGKKTRGAQGAYYAIGVIHK